VDVDEEEEASQAEDGLTHTVEDSEYSPGECEHWTVYFGHVKLDNGETKCNGKRCMDREHFTVISHKISKLKIYGRVQHLINSNSRELKCGTHRLKGIHCARRSLNGYNITGVL
jgi:hypothetical protein